MRHIACMTCMRWDVWLMYDTMTRWVMGIHQPGFLARIWERMSHFWGEWHKKNRAKRGFWMRIFWKLDISSALENAFSTNLGHKFTRFTASKIAGLYLRQCEMFTLKVLSSIPTSILADTATHSNTQQHTTKHSNTLQHTATQSDTLCTPSLSK